MSDGDLLFNADGLLITDVWLSYRGVNVRWSEIERAKVGEAPKEARTLGLDRLSGFVAGLCVAGLMGSSVRAGWIDAKALGAGVAVLLGGVGLMALAMSRDPRMRERGRGTGIQVDMSSGSRLFLNLDGFSRTQMSEVSAALAAASARKSPAAA